MGSSPSLGRPKSNTKIAPDNPSGAIVCDFGCYLVAVVSVDSRRHVAMVAEDRAGVRHHRCVRILRAKA